MLMNTAPENWHWLQLIEDGGMAEVVRVEVTHTRAHTHTLVGTFCEFRVKQVNLFITKSSLWS